MNFKTTIVLLALVAAGASLFFVGQQHPSLFVSKPPAPELGTRAALEKLKADDLTRIEIQHGGRQLILTREKGVWSMPGNWPTRTAEVNALVELLGGLRTRYEAIPLADDAELDRFGLQKPATTVKLETEKAKYHFILGEATATEEFNQFSRPTYLRLLSGPGVETPPAEVVRLVPGLLALLDRSPDYYQLRRLFPSEREPKEDDPTVKVDRLAAHSIHVEENAKEPGVDSHNKDLKYTLERRDKKWELAVPERDRLDPRVEETLMAALADLWAEHFAEVDTARAGLSAPTRKIVVTRDNGNKLTLLIGGPATSRTRRVPRPPRPGMPMFEPLEDTIVEEYQYAKLEDNPQIFEIKATALKDIFVTPDALRDARLARFSPPDVQEMEIAQPDKEPIQLVKEKERWKLVKPLQADADADKVLELLTQLSSLEARGDSIIAPDKHDPAAQGFDKPGVTITLKWETEKKLPDGEKKKTTGTTTLKLGKDDTEKKKLYIRTDDWPRINVVDDTLMTLVKREPVAYRGKRVLDFTAADVEKIDVRRGGELLTLKQEKDGWKLVAPVETRINGVKVNQMVAALGRLEVLDFENDKPTDKELAEKYGLGDKAPLIVTVTFQDANKPPRTLRLGDARDAKPGFYGKLDDGPAVFAVDGPIHALLDRDSLAYLPSELWQMQPADVTGVRIKKEGQDEYTLKHLGAKWQITGPFEAPALPDLANAIVEFLALARCESHTVHEAKELGKYGLDKPILTITLFGKDGKEAHTLLIGTPIDKDSHNRYAKLADTGGVFVIGEDLLVAVDRPALDLLDPLLLQLPPGKIERITTKTGDTTLTLEHKGDEWQVLDTPASPFAADKDAVSARRFPWSILFAEKFVAYGPKVEWTKYGLDKPNVVVTIAVAAVGDEPKEHTIELGKHADGDKGPLYVRVDKGQGVALLNEEVARLLTRPYLEYVNRDVLQFKADEVTQLQRQQGTATLEVARKDTGWQLVKPAEQRADDVGMRDLITRLANLKAIRVVEFPAKDLKTYGLDEPATIVTIKMKADAKPAEYVIKIGKLAEADGTARFALVGDSKAVIVLPALLSKRLTAAPITFHDRALARFADADKLRLERGPRQAMFARVDGSWKLVEPLVADADNDELDEFLNTLAKLRADELVAEKPTAEELKSYGLDKPEARWKLLAGDTEVLSLVIGGQEKDGLRRYAQIGGKDIVFLLDPKLSARSVGEFRARAVWSMPLDASQIESVRYGYTKNPFTLEKTPTGWQVAGKPDLKPNAGTVTETLAALRDLKVVRYVVDKGADLKLFGLDTPDVVIDVVTPNGKRTLLIGKPEGDSKRLYARIPEGERSDVFVIDAADAAKILRDAKAFEKAPERPMPPIPAPRP